MFKKLPDELYKEILENMPVFCVDIVIHSEGKVLLIKRKNDPEKEKWWIVGGRVLKNERFLDAVRRKVRGEARLDVQKVKFLYLDEYFSDKSIFEGVGTHSPVCVYMAEVKGLIKLDDASSDYKWIDKIEEDLEPYVQKALKASGVFN